MSHGLSRHTASAVRPQIDESQLPAITDREEAFVNAYLLDPSPLRAFRMSSKTKLTLAGAKAGAGEMMKRPEVREWIRALREQRARRTRVTQDRVMREVATLAFSNINHYEIDADGFVALRDGAPEEAMRAVSSVERTVKTDEDGNRVVTTKLKLWNKNDALNAAMKHLGMFIDRKLTLKLTLEEMMAAIAKGETPQMGQLEAVETGETNDDLEEWEEVKTA